MDGLAFNVPRLAGFETHTLLPTYIMPYAASEAKIIASTLLKAVSALAAVNRVVNVVLFAKLRLFIASCNYKWFE